MTRTRSVLEVGSIQHLPKLIFSRFKRFQHNEWGFETCRALPCTIAKNKKIYILNPVFFRNTVPIMYPVKKVMSHIATGNSLPLKGPSQCWSWFGSKWLYAGGSLNFVWHPFLEIDFSVEHEAHSWNSAPPSIFINVGAHYSDILSFRTIRIHLVQVDGIDVFSII